MGGSGGGGIFSGSFSPSELRRQVRESEDRATSDEFETDVANLIDAQLGDINQRDTETTQRHLDAIQAALGQDIEGSVSLLFGGSIAKRTYVNGLSDIDQLVILNKSELADMNPEEVKTYFAQQLRDRFPKTPLEVGRLAVTLKFSDIDIQLLPAVKVGSGVRIPSADGTQWSNVIRPDSFAKKLTDSNRTMNGKLVPTIKLAKLVLSRLPEDQQLGGYHIESLALKSFDGYDGPKTTKAMLKHFLSQAPDLVRHPIKDNTGQSVHVDDYLGSSGSLKRRIIADSIGRIGRTIQNADRAQSVEEWGDVFDVD